jgi:hypothetical protein
MNIHILPKARQMTQERLKEVLQYNPDTGVFTAHTASRLSAGAAKHYFGAFPARRVSK